jgi:hypothetical protein
MTEIRDEHVEWAVVDRLRQILEKPPATDFNVTHTYAVFNSIVCWIMQRVRVNPIRNEGDRVAATIFAALSAQAATNEPWLVPTSSAERIVRNGIASIRVPASCNFEGHNLGRVLINLRDAFAHGDARKILPFNVRGQSQRLLVGFKFVCEEYRDRRVVWAGEITLIEEDMRRIGRCLAKTYCNAMEGIAADSGDLHFAGDSARSVREFAARG